MEYDLHTLLDALTLVATLWVCRMMQTSVRTTYNEVLDPAPVGAHRRTSRGTGDFRASDDETFVV